MRRRHYIEVLIRRIALVFTLAFLAGCASPAAEPTPVEPTTPVSLSGCYSAEVGPDNAYLNLSQTGESVQGTMEYAFSLKDSSWGLVHGTASESALVLEYQYISEGVLSTRELTLDRTDTGLTGEGFTYNRTDSCGVGAGWSEAAATDINVSTIHDPENGYFARVRFLLAPDGKPYDYRCIATATDASQGVIVDWVGFGTIDARGSASPRELLTNITPEQVEEVEAASLACQVRFAN